MPLIAGPLTVAAGFVLFAVVIGGGSYWKTYFPAAIVLGFGMAITVAPLTTVVMSSADQRHAGMASGINNAVARVAGVLAIAVFGFLMVKIFDSRLEDRLAKLQLPLNIVHELRAKEIELAALQPPQDSDTNKVETIRRVIGESFVSGFRIVLACCAGLSVASAAVAWRLVAPPGTESSRIHEDNPSVAQTGNRRDTA